MTFDDYSAQAIQTDTFLGQPHPLGSDAFSANLLGLLGETGEIAEKFKKIFRDKDGQLSDEDRKELLKELGDVLWYVNIVVNYLDGSLDEVARQNLEKLASRQQRGILHGSGDNR